MKLKRFTRFFALIMSLSFLLGGCADAVQGAVDKVGSLVEGFKEGKDAPDKDNAALPSPTWNIGKDKEDADPSEETTLPEAETSPFEHETTQPAPVYETRTVYLCTQEKMTNYEDESTFYTGKSYDEYGRLIQSWRVMADGSQGAVTTYEYDELGNNIAQQNQSGGRYEMTYDEAGRLLSQCYYSSGECKSEHHYTYDEAGFVVEEVRISHYSDETLERYKINYNADHTEAMILRYENGAQLGHTEEIYNGNGQVIASDNFDAEGNWKSGSVYEYDSLGRLSVEWVYSRSETQADYDVIYTYDEKGLLISKNVDYYYGYLMEYTYEPFEVLVLVG